MTLEETIHEIRGMHGQLATSGFDIAPPSQREKCVAQAEALRYALAALDKVSCNATDAGGAAPCREIFLAVL